jgi:hypothetical protein
MATLIRSSTLANRSRSRGAFILFVSALSFSAPAWAQDTAASAESLFQDGKALMATHNYAAACPKLAESQRLDPGTGTLIALALCHEAEGKSASAWAEFNEVVAAARNENRRDREKAARSHAAALALTLSHLTVVVAPEIGGLEGFELRRDDVVVGQPSWGSALPVDPGDHVVIATAHGKRPWKETVTVGAKGDMKTLTVPALENAPDTPIAPAPIAPSSMNVAPEVLPQETGSGRGKRIAGWVVGGAGLASIGAGSVFGVEAMSKSSGAKSLCSPTACTNPSAVSENNTAKADALVADFAIGAGVAAVGVGAILILTTHGSKEAPQRGGLEVIPLASRNGGGVGLYTRW